MCRRCDWLCGELTLGSVIFQSVFFSLEKPERGGLSGLSSLSGLSGFLVERNSPDEPNRPDRPDRPIQHPAIGG
jgi:hypothetical protein